jgi:hypothetical protein
MEIQGTQRTPKLKVLDSNYTVKAGYKFVSIQTDSAFVGSILSTPAVADFFYSFPAPMGDTMSAIPIVCTAGSFTLILI